MVTTEERRPVVDCMTKAWILIAAANMQKIAIDGVAKALGVRVQFVDSVRRGTANAQIRGRTVLVEKDNRNPVMFLVGHEIAHQMQALAPDAYRAFRDFVAREEGDRVQARMDSYAAEGVELTREEALDELAADYAGRMIDEGRVLDDFLAKHRGERTLLQRVRDAIRALAARLTGGEKKKARDAERKLTAALEAAHGAGDRRSRPYAGRVYAVDVCGGGRHPCLCRLWHRGWHGGDAAVCKRREEGRSSIRVSCEKNGGCGEWH